MCVSGLWACQGVLGHVCQLMGLELSGSWAVHGLRLQAYRSLIHPRGSMGYDSMGYDSMGYDPSEGFMGYACRRTAA